MEGSFLGSATNTLNARNNNNNNSIRLPQSSDDAYEVLWAWNLLDIHNECGVLFSLHILLIVVVRNTIT